MVSAKSRCLCCSSAVLAVFVVIVSLTTTSYLSKKMAKPKMNVWVHMWCVAQWHHL